MQEIIEKWRNIVETQLIPLSKGDPQERICLDEVVNASINLRNYQDSAVLELGYSSGISAILFLILSAGAATEGEEEAEAETETNEEEETDDREEEVEEAEEEACAC